MYNDPRMSIHNFAIFLAAACSLLAQPVSSYKYTVKGDEKTVEITNVNYEELDSGLVLRMTTHLKHFVGEKGMEASTTTEAWKLGADLKTKPLYSVIVEGTESRTVEGALFAVSRGLDETDWWSVYKIDNGAHLFDTHVPLVKFSISRETLTMRYAGLEVPPDDTPPDNKNDKRLKEPHVVAVVSYASDAKVIREALITCDDLKQAPLLRSYDDETRSMTVSGETSKKLQISFSQNLPSQPSTINVVIPIAGDDLDLAHAQLPPHIHIAAWKR
jgi:hypothetical protein